MRKANLDVRSESLKEPISVLFLKIFFLWNHLWERSSVYNRSMIANKMTCYSTHFWFRNSCKITEGTP